VPLAGWRARCGRTPARRPRSRWRPPLGRARSSRRCRARPRRPPPGSLSAHPVAPSRRSRRTTRTDTAHRAGGHPIRLAPRSSSAQILLTSLRLMRHPPSAVMRSSHLRVLMPSTYTSSRARSMRRRGSSSEWKSCPTAAWGSAAPGAPSRCRESARASRFGTWFASTPARGVRPPNVRGCLGFDAPLGWRARAHASAGVGAVDLAQQRRLCHPSWAIVGVRVWVEASKRTPRWPSLSTSVAALGSPSDLHHTLRDITW
jgi:hypothetical protein